MTARSQITLIACTALLASALSCPVASAAAQQVQVGTNGHACATLPAGQVECWGRNTTGQTGSGTKQATAYPTFVSGLSGPVKQVSAGYYHTCALTVAGSVECWGSNDSGQLGNRLDLIHDDDGAWSRTPSRIGGLAGEIKQIATGGYFSCALSTAGEIACWGGNQFGQLGLSSNIGNTGAGSLAPTVVHGFAAVPKQIALGDGHACAIVGAGDVQCWGWNYGGQLGSPTGSPCGGACSMTPVTVPALGAPAVSVTAGNAFSCALLEGGNVKCWGQGVAGQLGGGFTSWDPTLPTTVQGLSGPVVGIDSGSDHSCALLEDGQSECWGDNSAGELAHPKSVCNVTDSVTCSSVAVLTQGLGGKVISISAGAASTCAIIENGDIKCWGWNGFGQLGDGTKTDSGVPVSVLNAPLPASITTAPGALTNSRTARFVISVAAGSSAACTLDAGTSSPCGSAKTYTALSDGTHTLTVVATDQLGHGAYTTITWLVDLTPPVITTSLKGAKVKTKSQTTYRLTARSDASGIVKAEYSTASSPSATAKPVASKTVTFANPLVFKTTSTIKWIRLQDGAGNWSRWYQG